MIKHTIKKEKEFVQISNSILTNSDISLKAKGMLTLMFSLPENWDFSIEGIAHKCKESVSCISATIKELENAGYIRRKKLRGENGQILKMEYEIFEEPYFKKPCETEPCTVFLSTEKPSIENPVMDIPSEEKPLENNIIINKTKNNNILCKNNLNNNTKSNPIKSNLRISFNMSEMELYRYAVRENIEYDILLELYPNKKEMIKEMVELMAETICSKKEFIMIAKDHYSKEYVKKVFLSIDRGHIEYVLESMENNKKKIFNIKQYILAAIFNAPKTKDNYYTAEVNHDLYG